MASFFFDFEAVRTDLTEMLRAGKEFVVIAGTIPPAAALYNLEAEQIYAFGNAHRNVICWAPHGRFLALCGFGNLAGDVDFWDRNKKKKIGSVNMPCAVEYGWSPDSRLFVTATTAPRMNVCLLYTSPSPRDRG